MTEHRIQYHTTQSHNGRVDVNHPPTSSLEKELAVGVYRLLNSMVKLLKIYIDRKWPPND